LNGIGQNIEINKNMETIKELCYGWIDEYESIAAMNVLLNEIEKAFKEEGLLSNDIHY